MTAFLDLPSAHVPKSVAFAADQHNVFWQVKIRIGDRHPESINIEVDIVSDISSDSVAIGQFFTIAPDKVIKFEGLPNFARFRTGVEDGVELTTRSIPITQDMELRRAVCKVPNFSSTFKSAMSLIKGNKVNAKTEEERCIMKRTIYLLTKLQRHFWKEHENTTAVLSKGRQVMLN